MRPLLNVLLTTGISQHVVLERPNHSTELSSIDIIFFFE